MSAAVTARAHAEADRFTRYLAGAPADDRIRSIYAAAIERDAGVPSARDTALLRFAERRPRSLGLLDAGLAVVEPEAELRRRLYITFAILESSPEYHARFLPTERSPAFVLVVALAGLRGVAKAVLGALLVKAVARS